MVYSHALMKRARQRLFPLRRLKRFAPGLRILQKFLSILTGCITAWYGKCTALDRKARQRVRPSRTSITGCDRRRAEKLPKTPANQASDCSLCLPSSKRYRSICSRTNRSQRQLLPLSHTTAKLSINGTRATCTYTILH
jgi:hypothetical protein